MRRKNVTKHINLSNLNISPPKILRFIELQASVGAAALHDINNSTGKIVNWTYMIRSRLEDKKDIQIGKKELEELLKYNKSIEEEAYVLNAFTNSIFATTGDMHNSLVSVPQIIINEITPNILEFETTIGIDAWQTLEFIYPENVLIVIIKECFNNSRKHNNNKNQETIVSWKMRENNFLFEIHDNGDGVIPDLTNETLPFSYIFDKLLEKGIRVSGLKIINKIIRNSEGNLFFSRSQILGGTKLSFQLPTIAYYYNGEIHEIN